jgi:7-cyano-7-deazaguanine synthase
MIFFLKVQRMGSSLIMGFLLRLGQILGSSGRNVKSHLGPVSLADTLKKAGFSFNIKLVMPHSRKALVLFSGGIDSTTALYWAERRYDQVEALTFDYGQRHRVEVLLARRLARRRGVPVKSLKVDLRQVGGSALTDPSASLPRFSRREDIGPGVPPTYVPFRNGIFLALAAAWAEANGSDDIVCGFNTIDSPSYPDTRASFVRAMQEAINLGTAAASKGRRIRIVAPFIRMKKSEIIRLGLSLGADYSFSVSCYGGREIPCRRCSSCLLRKRAWKEAGTEDHLIARLRKEGKI